VSLITHLYLLSRYVELLTPLLSTFHGFMFSLTEIILRSFIVQEKSKSRMVVSLVELLLFIVTAICVIIVRVTLIL
jgi:hypothetical protein